MRNQKVGMGFIQVCSKCWPKESPEDSTDWTAFRNDCAMRIAAGLAANQSEWNGLSPSVQGVQIAQDSVVIADALIAELKKGQGE